MAASKSLAILLDDCPAAVAWLGEEIGLLTVAGGLLVLAGVALVQRAPDRPRAKEAEA